MENVFFRHKIFFWQTTNFIFWKKICDKIFYFILISAPAIGWPAIGGAPAIGFDSIRCRDEVKYLKVDWFILNR